MTYKYIHFKQVSSTGKTQVYECRNNKSGAVLGMVRWYSPWRQYCFYPREHTIFNMGCLNDVNNFLTKLKLDRAKGRGLFD